MSCKRITQKLVQDTEGLPVAERKLGLKPEPEVGGWNEEGLTTRQALFVDKLIGAAGGNATEAAKLAGYSDENRHTLAQTASRLLTFVKVREAIARRLARANLTVDWVKQMTAALAASNMGTFLSLDDEGNPVIDWRQAQALGAFVQIRKYKDKGAKIGDKILIIERQIETHNPAPHLALLARMMGLVKDDGGSTTTVNVNVKQDVDYEAIESEIERIAQRSAVAGRIPADN